MTPEETAFEAAREWLGTALLGILGWLGIDIVRKFRRYGTRIATLEAERIKSEATRITRIDFDQLTASVTQQIAHNQLRTEERFDEVNAMQRLILDKMIPGAEKQ